MMPVSASSRKPISLTISRPRIGCSWIAAYSSSVSGPSFCSTLVGTPSLRSEEHTAELQSRRDLHSFPTRRSSDLPDDLQAAHRVQLDRGVLLLGQRAVLLQHLGGHPQLADVVQDRKSTRLNSS